MATANAYAAKDDATREAVVAGVRSGAVEVFWSYGSRMFVMDCFMPGGTEGCMDADVLEPYLWAKYFRLHGDETCGFEFGVRA
jgi:hypothetical protein